MSIYLGNLTIEEFEERTGWTFSKEDKDTFNRLKSEIKTAQKELDEYEMRKNKLKNFSVMRGKQNIKRALLM